MILPVINVLTGNFLDLEANAVPKRDCTKLITSYIILFPTKPMSRSAIVYLHLLALRYVPAFLL